MLRPPGSTLTDTRLRYTTLVRHVDLAYVHSEAAQGRPLCFVVGAPALEGGRRHPFHRLGGQTLFDGVAGHGLPGVAVSSAAPCGRGEQIGRASCRERVCQYV